jgi:hypothetical protein
VGAADAAFCDAGTLVRQVVVVADCGQCSATAEQAFSLRRYCDAPHLEMSGRSGLFLKCFFHRLGVSGAALAARLNASVASAVSLAEARSQRG